MPSERQARFHYESLMREGFELDYSKYRRKDLASKGYDTVSFNSLDYHKNTSNIIKAITNLQNRNVKKYLNEKTERFIKAINSADITYEQLIDLFCNYTESLL